MMNGFFRSPGQVFGKANIEESMRVSRKGDTRFAKEKVHEKKLQQ